MYYQHIIIVDFYYCTSYGEIKGVLTINPYLIMFDPYVDDVSNKEKIKD